ncbi:MAG: carboxylating nicotinate-nucleotide diphosphorylase [Bacteroidetes bacterium]|nr:carboxylating nicotinate-nucleotide diphosphorylase [Bacteroidota bacterium]
MTIDEIIENALLEDIGDGDHTSLSCIPVNSFGKAKLLVKEEGIIAGIEIARKVFEKVDKSVIFNQLLKDGDEVKPGDIVFTVEGNPISLLSSERLALNFLQRMSGIATKTHQMVKLLEGLNTKLLDTRKTTPNLRLLEKMAVKIGGGENHRFGLYDMIMIKDNHVDFSGGIRNAITNVNQYLKSKNKNLKIEIEVRNFDELNEVLAIGGIHRIMLDNFTPENLKKAVGIINGLYETEASGGITELSLRQYAETGVDFISVGSLTHHIKSLDLSLKAY